MEEEWKLEIGVKQGSGYDDTNDGVALFSRSSVCRYFGASWSKLSTKLLSGSSCKTILGS